MSAPRRCVLITGATGRIGRLLMARLPELGWKVHGVDVSPHEKTEHKTAPPQKTLTLADVGEMATVRQIITASKPKIDTVIHLAATPNAKPGWSRLSALNIQATRAVLEAARQAGVAQMIYASSIHTIGGLAWGTPLGPHLPPVPSGTYGVTKLACEGLLRVYAVKAGMRTIAVRLCSFRPRPHNGRELVTWLGYEDTVHLFDRCLRDHTDGYQMVWGVSNNTRLTLEDPTARRIGYRPQQNAEAFTTAQGGDIDADRDAPWSLMGGPVAEDRKTDFSD
ncbi:MAG: NAD(P)-dependent oxidoreductase [Pseudomonadota bacterium]